MPDALLQFRSEFPILERTNYLNSNSLGAMPRGVYDAMNGYADTWATRGVRAWEERWWMLAAEVGDELGALMNAPGNAVSTHQNVTTCQAVVASCLDFSGKRNKVVYSDMNFPSVMYFWEAQRRLGARVHMVKTDDGITRPDRATAGCHRRPDAPRPDFARDVPERVYQRCRRHYRESPQGRRSRGARHVSVAWHCARSMCRSSIRRLRLRRRFEMAMRRTGTSLTSTFVPTWGRSSSRDLPGWHAHQNRSASRPARFTTPIRLTDFMNGTTHIPSLEAARPGSDDHHRRRALPTSARNQNARPRA